MGNNCGPSTSSWPGLSRPSTSFSRKACKKGVDARDKRGHDERVGWVERVRSARFALPTLQVLAMLLVAPLAAAQTIEDKVQACAACYGGNGIPPDKSWPLIWGQHQGYLYLQLRDFRSGRRGNNPGMSDLMNATSEDDLKALAVYLAGS